jgi:hypothetical protein
MKREIHVHLSPVFSNSNIEPIRDVFSWKTNLVELSIINDYTAGVENH